MRASEIQPSKLVIFDIDDTLVHTQTRVHVIRDGRTVRSLNSHDFTHYKLQPGESFDFGDFEDAREFFTNAKPIIPLMNQLKHDIATGNKVVMVTARSDFNDRELFLDTFRKYGVDMSRVHVYRAGNIKQKIQTEEKKKIIIRHLLDQAPYTKAIMYDDARPNLDSFVELKKEYPSTKFYAWHVSPEGEATEYHRTNEHAVAEDMSLRDPVIRTVADFYINDVGLVHKEPVEDYVAQAKDLLSKVEDKSMKVKILDIFKQAKKNPYIQGSVITAVGAILAGGVLGSAQKFGLSPTQTNMALQAILNTVIPTMVSRVNGRDWNETLKYTLASVGMGVGSAGMMENFADGKKPGRKGLAKRVGVNCKQPVSKLRSIAAHSSGERQRMANWCANMKSGKSKK
jgi:FMN phosphatase YigB (HAD superfamily)